MVFTIFKNAGSPVFPETLHCIRLYGVTGWFDYGSTLMLAENCTMLMMVYSMAIVNEPT